MRLTLVISSLSCGGAERVLSTMANYWAGRGEEVTLLTFESAAADFYALDPKVQRVGLGLRAKSTRPWTALRNNLRRIVALRSAVLDSEPEVVISFVHKVNISTLLATTNSSVKVVISERVDATRHTLGRPWTLLRRLLYPRSSAVVVQSDAMRHWVEKIVPVDKVFVIPNPIQPHSTFDSNATPESLHKVIAMGRLTSQKGFDLLLQAFARCVQHNPNWSLTVLGEGPERARLEALTEDLGLSGRVSLPGQVAEPTQMFASADLFVLSSRYEGFPNALLEAMASGLAAISFDCPSGPSEIITDGVDGVLVEHEDVGALATAMGRLMDDEEERRRMGARAREVIERFGLEKVTAMWEDVLKRVVESRT